MILFIWNEIDVPFKEHLSTLEATLKASWAYSLFPKLFICSKAHIPTPSEMSTTELVRLVWYSSFWKKTKALDINIVSRLFLTFTSVDT